ncbi:MULTISPECIES: PadR family transcriptional regulator [unclassified Micromonospora]|uniref:PadR family transcriptional regulator n=1 Tax=unclassified Micromonospora TaxID=2617518 RepID=UPI0010349820|nr:MULTISPECIES: PadR family transcriptional regulator [unclassified Micromonospora]QKW11561.1 PadR family transcriptional regulator [Verrucosispora sp. NA02020]QKW11685.1 PadR family transcriptional regulator [Verrucosispora sp. NA02020]TBL27729.1 PadR family transcriptional regulator [Verrucosispora sp. SN26_14.1]
MDPDRRGQWLRGVLDLCVLALLREGESYGYQLAQSLDAAGVGPIQGGTLYPVLLRLQRTGLVTAQWREGGSGPARKYYQLTDDGRAALHNGGNAWLTFVAPVTDIVSKGVEG